MSKQFKPLLAAEVNLDTLRFPVYVSPKLDGIRTLIIDGKAVTRSLKPIPNKHIRETLERHADLLNGFDGELVVGEPTAKDCFNVTSSAVMSFDGEPDFSYFVFDRIAGGSYKDRWMDKRDVIFNTIDKLDFVISTPTWLVKDFEDVMDYEQQWVNAGFEGVMIRSPEGMYKYGRSTQKEQYLLKLKRFSDDEAVIIGFEERMHNGNQAETNALGHTERSSHKDNMQPMNTLGALIVKSKKFDGEFRIGTGFDDETRQYIWDNRVKWLWTMVKYKYQACGVKDKPRFPVYLGIRSKDDL